ncbi:phosphate ABC transporter substrate-binding protein [Paenibacillus sp. IB182496]|uniref:Phosphate-binding protein n=1 Tax=Paenibacillus sabuli TaxID=2772509 RepID=A0A927GSX6_9BACL|nr:phosphate ABC transporter substrate-binding protein [Paenibacillus sabuli]MBD2846495.1 phosphate ABC transporter substrate-binding protein [Paenibacillus sabuli]
MKKAAIVMMALVLTFVLAACGQSNNNGTNNGGNGGNTTNNATQGSGNAGGNAENEGNAGANEGNAASELSGSIIASGSSALQPLVDQASRKFMDENPGVTIQVQGGGSGTGLAQVSEKQVDIGNSDVYAEEKLDADKAAELVDHQVAVVAMAAVVNPEVTVDNLTKQQLIDIFSGNVTNWSEVGGQDQAIQIVNRPSSSGTRATFETYALGMKTEDLQGSIQEDSSGTVRKLVGETPGAIGYLALSYLDDSVKTLQYDGVDATEENVANGTYPIWAYEHMYTNGEPNEVVAAFLEFMMSPDVQEDDVVELGYIPSSLMQIERDQGGNVTEK